MTLFMDRLPDRIRIPINYFVQILSILFCLSLFIASTIRAIQSVGSGAILGTLDWPVWPGYVVVSIGLLFLLLPILFDLSKVKSRDSDLFQEDMEEGFIDAEITGEDSAYGGEE